MASRRPRVIVLLLALLALAFGDANSIGRTLKAPVVAVLAWR